MSQLPLPLPDGQRGDADPWSIPGPGAGPGAGAAEPTNLIALWPGPDQPTLEQVMVCLRKAHGGPIELLQPVPPRDEQMIWAQVIQPKGWPTPLIIWAEPMREMSSDNLKFLNAESIKWAVGTETLLRPDDPLADFVKLLRLLGRGFADSPAILDVNKEGWYTRQELDEEVLPDHIVLTESLLWITHAVGAQSSPTPQCKIWIYTDGLSRCGLPELEMLEVPHAHVGSAMSLLNSIGELIVEGGMPPAGQPMEVGPDLAVTLQPWREVAPFVSEGSLGGMDRVNHNGEPAQGVRAVVCATEPAGTYRKIWVWPSRVVQTLASTGQTVIYKTARAGRRQAALARATWDELAGAFADLPAAVMHDGKDRQIVFLIKAAFQQPRANAKAKDEPAGDIDMLSAGGREDLWFELKCFKAGRAEGLLMNQPHHIPHLREGELARIDRGIICDWQVLTRLGNFGPSNVRGLHEVIQQIKKGVA